VPKAPPAPPTPKTVAPSPSAPTTSAPTTLAPGVPSATAETPTPAASASAPGISSKAGGSAEDAIITGRVKAELLKATDGKSIDINVDTQNGVVHLTGFARSNSDIDSALEIARRVEGVKDVRHKLAVKPS
jgi:hyperosmotically inducible protein